MNAELAIDALSEWAQIARREQATKPSDASTLCFNMQKARFILSSALVEYRGRTLIAFEIDGGKRIGERKRHLLPAHFAVLRLLEVIPGLTLLLRDDQHRSQDVKTGRVRSEDEMIFNLAMKTSARKASRLRILQVTKLDRVLFDVNSDTRLYERRSGDHHYILPSCYVPIRFRGAPLHTQPDLVRAVKALVDDQPDGSLGKSSSEIVDLLKTLLAVGNDRHWNELIDRLPGDTKSFTAIS